MRKNGKTIRRLRKLSWNLALAPATADNSGVMLPTRHPAITTDISRSIYFGDYEKREAGIVLAKIEKTDIVMEVGAGIGFMSTLCAKHIGSERVHAYEANPELMPVIAHIHQLNQVAPEVRNVLLGRGDGRQTFHIRRDFFLSSSLTNRTEASEAVEIRQVDLNQEIERIKPTFLILDIEGGEVDLLQYADLTGVRKLCMEIHPSYVGNERLSGMFAQLLAAGFIQDYSLTDKNVVYLYRAD